MHGGFKIGIVEQDVWRVSAQFLSHALYGKRCGFGNFRTGAGGAGERNHVDRFMGDQRRTDRAPAQNEVDGAGRHARLRQQLDEPDRRQRGELAGLDDHGAARHEGGGELPRNLQEWVVPRRDQRTWGRPVSTSRPAS